MSPAGPIAVGVQGTSLTGSDRERLAHPLVGMVILFNANYESPEQLIRLCSDIHALRDPPLLIAVDHEGGRVQRFAKVSRACRRCADWANCGTATSCSRVASRRRRLCDGAEPARAAST
jgi:beta-glucosidase-like glycosyl hydrolase